MHSLVLELVQLDVTDETSWDDCCYPCSKDDTDPCVMQLQRTLQGGVLIFKRANRAEALPPAAYLPSIPVGA